MQYKAMNVSQPILFCSNLHLVSFHCTLLWRALEKSTPYAADSSGFSSSSSCRLSLAKNNNVNYELMWPTCVCG